MDENKVVFRVACAADDSLAHAFFKEQLPDFPGAMTAFWPSWQRQGLLPYSSFGQAWLALSGGRVVGLSVLEHRHATTWAAFLLVDMQYEHTVLPQLHRRLRRGIIEFAQIPLSRRVQITEVIAEVLESHHSHALDASYRATEWSPMEHVYHVEVLPTDIRRLKWLETLRQAAKSGIVVSRLQDCSAADRQFWNPHVQSSALPDVTWVAHIKGKPCASNYWTLVAQDLWTVETTPEYLHATHHEELIAQALLAAMLLSIEPGRAEEWFVVTTGKNWCDWVAAGDRSDPLRVGVMHSWTFNVAALTDEPEPLQ
jgi:hypothetical protein